MEAVWPQPAATIPLTQMDRHDEVGTFAFVHNQFAQFRSSQAELSCERGTRHQSGRQRTPRQVGQFSTGNYSICRSCFHTGR